MHGNKNAREECLEKGISLDLGICASCGKNYGKYMAADGPICKGCMPPEFMEFCAEVTKDAVREGGPLRGSFVYWE